MEFFEKVGETITAKGKDVADKAKDFAEIASLRSQISTCEEVMKKNYLEIGKLYYEQFKEAEYNDFVEQCTAITNAKNGVEALEAKKLKEYNIWVKRAAVVTIAAFLCAGARK